MTQSKSLLQRDIYEVIVWCIATPVLSTWALVSVLPMVSVITAWGDLIGMVIALAFLATSAFALLAVAVGYRFFIWQNSVAPALPREGRTGRIAVLTAYALVWMALYGTYTFG